MTALVRSKSWAAGPTPLSVTKPAGTVSGDVLVAIVNEDFSAGTNILTPTGWTKLPSETTGMGLATLTVFWKTATGAEPASYSFADSAGGAETTVATLLCLQNAGSPEVSARTSGNSGTVTAPSVITLGADRLLVAAFAGESATAIAPQASMTDQGYHSSANSEPLDVATEAVPVSGASGDRTATITASGSWAGILVAVPPLPGTVKTGNVTLYVYGKDVKTSQASLFIAGKDVRTSGPPLYVYGKDQKTGSIPLYLLAPRPASQSIPLFVAVKDARSQTVTLFVWGKSSQTGSALLWVNGTNKVNEGLPLVVAAPVATPLTAQVPLLIWGTAQQGIRQGMPLFIPAKPLSVSMVLFLKGSTLDRTLRNMNLWVGGKNPWASASLPLFAGNSHPGLTGSVPLFLQTAGTLVGGQAASESMVLYVKRPFEQGIPLWIQAPGAPLSQSCPLFLAARMLQSGSVSLVLPAVLGSMRPSLKLYLMGW